MDEKADFNTWARKEKNTWASFPLAYLKWLIEMVLNTQYRQVAILKCVLFRVAASFPTEINHNIA